MSSDNNNNLSRALKLSRQSARRSQRLSSRQARQSARGDEPAENENMKKALAMSARSATENNNVKRVLALSARSAKENNNVKKALAMSARSAKENNNVKKAMELSLNNLTKRVSQAKIATENVGRNLERENVHIATTLGDGNCFFSAVFRALRERDGFLEKLKECYPELNITEERPFIRTLRNAVARRVDFETFFNFYRDLYTNDRATLEEQLSDEHGFDPEQIDIIRKYLATDEPDRERFENEYRKYIRTDTNYASDIEFDGTKNLLRACDIEIITHSESRRKAPSVLSKTVHGVPVIHLYNAGNNGEGVHYEYFSFLPLSNPRRTRKNRRNS